MYAVKEIFKTLQGEGSNVGKAFIFCRFTGCNLWSGREQDRASAACKFCDTDFVGMDGELGGRYSAEDLCNTIEQLWDNEKSPARVVFTGGEPLLQLNTNLIECAKLYGFYIAVETNGTLPAPLGLDHICVSPKTGTDIRLTKGDELKLVYPQRIDPTVYEQLDFKRFYLQPLAGDAHSVEASIKYCLDNPKWSLSLQTHKVLGLP
jgi:7-carboxy-7-deazaguanine synthase (Cx14CxxC type)